MIHLLGVALVPPCIDPVLADDDDAALVALVEYVPGPWSPVFADVDCPACVKWVRA